MGYAGVPCPYLARAGVIGLPLKAVLHECAARVGPRTHPHRISDAFDPFGHTHVSGAPVAEAAALPAAPAEDLASHIPPFLRGL